MSAEAEVLLDFYKTIWREEKGHVYLALKDPSKERTEPGYWNQRFFEWPTDAQTIVQTTINERQRYDVYFAPALFREPSSKKEHVAGAFCFWLEFDGNLPVDLGEVPNPTVIVQTSTETHQHLYWCLDQIVEVDRIEQVNRALAYQLGADTSGWDANQVLRPPLTLNHRKRAQAKLVVKGDKWLNSVAFSNEYAKNLPPKIELNGQLPALPEVIRKYSFDRKVWELFTKGVKNDRSAGLMALGYHLAEMNLTNIEILALLLDADKRWGKFKGRDDQLKRLGEIVTHARTKYPYRVDTDKNETALVAIGDLTLRSTEVKVDWLVNGLLHQTGYLLLTGHTGVGKSQFCGDLANHLVLGQDFLGREVTTEKRVLFISLEMGLVELKWLRGEQLKNLSEQDIATLDKNLKFLPVGYPIYYNRDENRKALEELIQKGSFDVVIFDSLGSMTEQELSKETDAKLLMDWNDHLRVEFGISTIIIHHHRKAQTGNKRPNSIADIYGSHYFTARASTVMTLWDPKKSGLIEVSFQKMRMSAPEKPWAIQRKDDLTFQKHSGRIDMIYDDTDSDVDVTDGATEIVEEFEL